MNLGFWFLGAVLIFMVGYVVGTITTIVQWDSIIKSYKQTISNWQEMYDNMSDNYINEIKAHAKTINEFTEERFKWERMLEK